MKRVFSFLLCLSLIACSVLYVFFARREEGAQAQYDGILTLWHIDSFEGGKGSRAAFLNRAASLFEKQTGGVFVMVSTYTPEGAKEAIRSGRSPDLLSFSCGLDGAAELCRALSVSFAGGEIGQNCYAYPWCCGAYYLFCLEDDFSALSADNLLLSEGGNNLTMLAAALHGVTGNAACEDSTSAYVHFLNGNYRYMLGTQRDVCRFASRGVNVFRQKLDEYSDLCQYIAVTTKEEEAVSACEGFISTLLSGETQAKLTEIGMESLSDFSAQNTLPAFTSAAALSALREESRLALQTGDIKFLKSYLKILN